MLLNELATGDDVKIKKINKALKETFGFTLASEIEMDKLDSLYTKVADDLYNLKLNLGNARSADYMKTVLMLEGLKILKQQKLDEQLLGGRGGRAYEKVVNWLKIAVEDACEKGDDYDEAVYDAMKQYRSSMYRFEDDLVEFDLRKVTQDCAGEMAFTEGLGDTIANVGNKIVDKGTEIGNKVAAKAADIAGICSCCGLKCFYLALSIYKALLHILELLLCSFQFLFCKIQLTA